MKVFPYFALSLIGVCSAFSLGLAQTTLPSNSSSSSSGLAGISKEDLHSPLALNQASENDLWTIARPDGHAPFGVMGDHLHHAGEWMLGYHFMAQHSQDLLNGDNSISTNSVFATRSPDGDFYMTAPTSMDMYMHMGELMYAPTDYLTLMVMGNYMQMDMDMVMNMSDSMDGSVNKSDLMKMSHSVNGWSDTALTALIQLFNAHYQTAHLQIGVSVPTGSVSEKYPDGNFLHYMMQLGSGTWDLLPGITYLGQAKHLSWGAQYTADLRLEQKNASGYRLGNIHQLTSWLACPLSSWASVSARIAYEKQGNIHGEYNGPHYLDSPPDFPQNYGGNIVSFGTGLNLRGTHGVLKGHRLAVEALWPIYQDLNGIQLERRWTIYTGWQWSF